MNNQITPDQLFQIIGELTVETRILRQELARLQKEIIDSKAEVKNGKQKDN